MERIGKKTILAFLTAVCAVVGLSLALCTTSVSAQEKSVGLQYSFDFTDYSAENGTLQGPALAWTNDVYDYSGLRLAEGTGDEPFCLSTWRADFATGYVTYKLKADPGKSITSLRLSVSGRVFHFQHEGCKECRMEIAAGKTSPALDEALYTVQADTSGISLPRTFDLSEQASGASEFYVRITLRGSGNTWVNVEQLAFTGTQAYDGFPNESVRVSDADQDLLYRLPASGSLAVTPKELIVETDAEYETQILAGPLGGTLSPVSGDWKVTRTGSYSVEYRVTVAQSREYTAGYTFYVIKEEYADGFATSDDGVWDKSAMQDLSNYVLGSGASIEPVAEGIRLDGAASYLQVLPFDSRFNFIFRLSSSVGSNGHFRFAVLGKAGEADFSTMSVPGLYFTGKKMSTGGLLLNGYFSDGNSVSLLGQQVLPTWDGVHGIGFNRRDAEPFTGLDIYMDSGKYASYACCYTVNTDKFMPEGQVYMAFEAFNCDFRIEKIVRSDSKNPVLKNRDGTDAETSLEAEVGKIFTLPDYVMEDETDGVVPYTLQVTDPNGQAVQVEDNGFLILYQGRYSVLYTAKDYSGNTGSKNVRVTARLPEGAAQMRFDRVPEQSGRVGVEYILPCPEVTIDGEEQEIAVQVRLVEPDGTEQTLVFEPGQAQITFTPETVGTYQFYYSVTNSVATVCQYYATSIKLNVDPQDSYTDIFEAGSWTGTGMKETDGGIRISGSAFSVLPFEMSSGIEITADLSGLGNKKASADDYIDCWAALAIGHAPQYTLFSAPEEGFIYFMFYREDSDYYVNVLARSNGVDYGILNAYLLGESEKVIVSVQKRSDSEAFADNVYIYVNHVLANAAVSSMIAYSDIVDNENFCYLSVSNFGTSSQAAEAYKSLAIEKITVCDQEAPVVQLSGEWVQQAGVGQSILLPEVTVSDNLNNGMRTSIAFYAPDGKKIEYHAGNFVPESEGTYYLIVKAVDDAGNDLLSVFELDVTKEKEFPVGLVVGISCGALVLIAGGATAGVLLKKKHRKKAGNE